MTETRSCFEIFLSLLRVYLLRGNLKKRGIHVRGHTLVRVPSHGPRNVDLPASTGSVPQERPPGRPCHSFKLPFIFSRCSRTLPSCLRGKVTSRQPQRRRYRTESRSWSTHAVRLSISPRCLIRTCRKSLGRDGAGRQDGTARHGSRTQPRIRQRDIHNPTQIFTAETKWEVSFLLLLLVFHLKINMNLWGGGGG